MGGSHLKTCIKFIGDKTTMVRVELAVVDHLSPNVIFPQMLSFPKCYLSPNVTFPQMLSFNKCYLSANVIFPQVISLFKNPSGVFYVPMCSYLSAAPSFLIFTRPNATVSHHHQCNLEQLMQSTKLKQQTNNNTNAASPPTPATLLLKATTQRKYFQMTERTHVLMQLRTKKKP